MILILIYIAMGFPALAQELTILTSFPPKVTDAYVKLWNKSFPDTEVRVLNKNTVAAIDEVLRGNERQFDIFWATSPEAFEILRRREAFVDETVCGQDGPDPIEPFALSSMGWARRVDNTVFMPGEWNDLLRPIYRDRIAMARPARSGTMHMLVEQLLLLRGWEEGWAFLLELSSNLSTLTARSYGVPDGLVNERFDLGLTVDFLSQSLGETLQFRYGRPVVLVAAQIGILENGEQSDRACEFVKLVLSRAGQMALLSPDISRIPYDASIRKEFADQLPEDIIEALKLPWFDYDARMSSDRYWAVNTLFDVMVTERLVERRDLWRRYHALNGKAPDNALREVRQMLTTVVITSDEAINASQRVRGGMRSTALAGVSETQRRLLQQWRDRTDDLLTSASTSLSALETRVAE